MKDDAMLRYYLMKMKKNDVVVYGYGLPKWHDLDGTLKQSIKSTASFQFFAFSFYFNRLNKTILQATGIMKLLAQPRKDR